MQKEKHVAMYWLLERAMKKDVIFGDRSLLCYGYSVIEGALSGTHENNMQIRTLKSKCMLII